MYSYQIEGVEWMKKRETLIGEEVPEHLTAVDMVKGGILADEVGLGKTLMTIQAIVNNPKPKTLVLVPKSLVGQWEAEIKKFAPDMSVYVSVKGEIPKGDRTVTIMSQSRMNARGTDPATLDVCKVIWDRVVIDEAHCIKNRKSKLHKACAQLRTGIRWALTATPVMNKMNDFVHTLGWIGIPQGLCQNHKRDVADIFIMRRTKEDVHEHNEELRLPPCHTNIHRCDFVHDEEMHLYMDTYERSRKEIKKMAGRDENNAVKALELLLRVRQVCCHPQTYLDGMARKRKTRPVQWSNGCTKLDSIMGSVKKQPEGDKGLIFCHFIREMDAYCEALDEAGIGNVRLDGSMDMTERANNVAQFNEEARVVIMVVQIQTGGVGYNFQVANHIYITSPTWNPAMQHQVIGRAHRTGQKKDVHVNIYAIGKPGEVYIEDYIMSLQQKKLKMISEVLNDPRISEERSVGMGASVTFADVAKMFSSKPCAPDVDT